MKTKLMMRIAVGIVCAIAMAGCATTGGADTAAVKAPDPAEVTKVLGEWGTALGTKNIDSIMAFYSDSFQDAEGRGKAQLKTFIEDAIANGYLDGAKIDVANAQVSLNGDQAVVAPISLSGDMGEVSLSLSLKKEATGWRIVSSSMA